MRTYVTPVKLHQFDSNNPDTCIKCNQERGSLVHCLWECVKICEFWVEIDCCRDFIAKVTPWPKGLYFGDAPGYSKSTEKQTSLLDMCLLQARRLIALSWKNTTRPQIGQWLREMSCCLSMEKITYILKGKNDLFKESGDRLYILFKMVTWKMHLFR